MTVIVTEETQKEFPLRFWGILSIICALLAAIVAGYLTYVALVAKGLPLGCGAGSGCSEVLRSQWSEFFGLPVSVFGLFAYGGLALAVLVARNTKLPLISFLSGLILFSAAWFVLVQLVILQSICPWCMLDHALGGTAALLALVVTRSWEGVLKWTGALAGVLPVVILAIVQSLSDPPASVVLRLPAGQNGDTGPGAERVISIANGTVSLDLKEELLLGEPTAENVLVMLMDYACPHCRRTHGFLDELMKSEPGKWCVVLLPVPLNADCNPHIEETHSRFADSCALATLAMGVRAEHPDRFAELDHWLLEPETPRKAEEARAKIVEMLGQASVDRAANWPKAGDRLKRNTNLYGAMEQSALPMILSPHLDTIVGRPESVEELKELLEQVKEEPEE